MLLGFCWMSLGAWKGYYFASWKLYWFLGFLFVYFLFPLHSCTAAIRNFLEPSARTVPSQHGILTQPPLPLQQQQVTTFHCLCSPPLSNAVCTSPRCSAQVQMWAKLCAAGTPSKPPSSMGHDLLSLSLKHWILASVKGGVPCVGVLLIHRKLLYLWLEGHVLFRVKLIIRLKVRKEFVM